MNKASENKKILFVIPYFAPAWSYGGPVRVTFDFAKELTRMGNSVTVVTTDVLDSKQRNKKLREKIEGIQVIRFKNFNNKLAKNFNLYIPVGMKKWLDLNIKNYDVIHIHEFFTYQSIITGRICHKLNKKYVFQPHGSLFSAARKSKFYTIKNFIIKRFASLALNSSAVIVLNEKEKKGVLEILPQIKSKIEIVPNGLDLSEYWNIKPADVRKSYGIPHKDKIIVFIGRIHRQKGLDISLKVLSKIKDRLSFTFLIIGPDEGERANIERLARRLGLQDRIIFTGLLSGIKKLEILKSADLSLLNSRSEGLPTSLLESAALGLPIVCSLESNLPTVEKFKAGFVVKGESKAAESIKIILKDGNLHSKLSKNALKLAESYNIKDLAIILKDIYNTK
ncbi:MAG: glycosyl transferase group 1 [Berkelbacteria bacterium GW2011_GWE1_39_12]|uniref:Glycosyl transferase group 1 n=1 Tax=Berkelbacteria bacterium GW2011_GWE1_39_12 TaxID=1618337 RepID=A0A0G4B3U7_9BACT|nr:MAG: glycosyl transferase group 1 [Berkelbacteria bacterium GW2011_GWE1_39_12]